MLTVVCLSVAYIGPKSRTERPRKTKIGTEVAHVTRDSDTIFKVKMSMSRSQGRGILSQWRPPAQLVLDVAGFRDITDKLAVDNTVTLFNVIMHPCVAFTGTMEYHGSYGAVIFGSCHEYRDFCQMP